MFDDQVTAAIRNRVQHELKGPKYKLKEVINGLVTEQAFQDAYREYKKERERLFEIQEKAIKRHEDMIRVMAEKGL